MDASLEWGSLDSLEIDGDVFGQNSVSLPTAVPVSSHPHVAEEVHNSQRSQRETFFAAGAAVAGCAGDFFTAKAQDADARVQPDSVESLTDIWAAAPCFQSSSESPIPALLSPPARPCASPSRNAAAFLPRPQVQSADHGAGRRRRAREVEEEEEDEASILQRCRREGPPGPAGALPALTCSWTSLGTGQVPNANARGAGPLSECIGWLCVLKALDLPFDRFHLCGDGPCTAPSFLARQNLAEVSRHCWPPKRWHLAVVVRRVELVAGEIDVIVGDPTGEMGATVDRRVPATWPRAACEGTALLLAGVTAVCKTGGPCRLLIMDKSVVRAFSAGEVGAEEADRLLAAARSGRG